MAHPLRQPTSKDVEWVWSEAQERAWCDIKIAITQAPFLRFYSLQDEGTLQCNASKAVVGGALLQIQQPVSFTSRTLTEVERRVCTNREGAHSHSVCLREVRQVHLWA